MADQKQEQQRVRSKHAYRACIFSACLNGIIVENIVAWAQSAVPQLVSPPPDTRAGLKMEEVSWITGIMFTGAMIGSIASMTIADRFGKRKLFILASGIYIVALSILTFASTFWAIADAFGEGCPFWVTALLIAVHQIVLMIIFPETREKSLIEIQELLES